MNCDKTYSMDETYEKLQKELPVEINVFDIIYYNGKSLLKEPFEKRTAIIKKILDNQKYKIVWKCFIGRFNKPRIYCCKILWNEKSSLKK